MQLASFSVNHAYMCACWRLSFGGFRAAADELHNVEEKRRRATMRGRSQKKLKVPDLDRQRLQRWLRSAKSPRKIADRARIILELDTGKSVEEVAVDLGVSKALVYRWCKRYRESGLDGLRDRPRSGRPAKLTNREVENILKSAIQKSPERAENWSIRSMARHVGVTKWQIEKVWKVANRDLHRYRSAHTANS